MTEATQAMGWVADERGLGGARVRGGMSWDLPIDEARGVLGSEASSDGPCVDGSQVPACSPANSNATLGLRAMGRRRASQQRCRGPRGSRIRTRSSVG